MFARASGGGPRHYLLAHAAGAQGEAYFTHGKRKILGSWVSSPNHTANTTKNSKAFLARSTTEQKNTAEKNLDRDRSLLEDGAALGAHRRSMGSVDSWGDAVLASSEIQHKSNTKSIQKAQ